MIKTVISFLSACIVLAGAGQAFEIAPHRAMYDLSLSKHGGDVADVRGSMLFEWEDACDGWNVTQRTVMAFTYQNGQEVKIAWNVTTWEAKDGLSYRFFVRRFENGELAEEFRGAAKLDGAGKGGFAEYTLPEKRSLELPAGTLLPTAHSLELLRRIEAGDQLFWATIFDGYTAKGLSDLNAVVTARLAAEAAAPELSPLLSAAPSSRVSIAFFGREGQAAEPEHEQMLRLHQNGVVESLKLDYGDFTIDGKLTELKSLPPDC